MIVYYVIFVIGLYLLLYLFQVTKSMAGVVKSMDATLKSMNLEKVDVHLIWNSEV